MNNGKTKSVNTVSIMALILSILILLATVVILLMVAVETADAQTLAQITDFTVDSGNYGWIPWVTGFAILVLGVGAIALCDKIRR